LNSRAEFIMVSSLFESRSSGLKYKTDFKRGKIDTPNTQIDDHSLLLIGTSTSIKKSDTLN